MISPNLQNPFYEKYEGNIVVTGETFTLYGIIVGTVVVRDGGTLVCNGLITRNVNVDDCSKAIIHGVVKGMVLGTGHIQVSGMVKNSPQ